MKFRLLCVPVLVLVMLAAACGGKRHAKIVAKSAYAPPVIYVEGEDLPTREGDMRAEEAGTFVITPGGDTFDLGEGRGLLVNSVVEGDILADGNLVRLAQAAGRANATWAIGVSRGGGLQIERETGRAIAYGTGPIVVLDLNDASLNAKKEKYENIRANFIWPGDTWSFLDRNIRFVPEKTQGREATGEETNDTIRMLGSLVRRAMASRDFAASGTGPATHQLLIRRDNGTMILGGDFAPGEGVSEYPTITRARLDIVPLER